MDASVGGVRQRDSVNLDLQMAAFVESSDDVQAVRTATLPYQTSASRRTSSVALLLLLVLLVLLVL